MNIPDPRKVINPATGGIALAIIALFVAGTAVETAPVAAPLVAFGMIVALYESLDREEIVNFLLLPVFVIVIAALVVGTTVGLAHYLGYPLVGGMKSLESLTYTLAKLNTILAILAFGFGYILENALARRDNEDLRWWHKVPTNFAVYVMVMLLLTIVCVQVTYWP